MIKYIYEDMGLDDISFLDLREIDPPAALGPNLIMLLATARSERHLHISAGRFVRWLKKHHKVSARAGGLIGPGELKTKLRRLRKKAKLLGTNTAIVPGGDNGISTGWVCVSFSASGHEGSGSDEAASFDEEGNLSGFGASLDGTTVVVQCMTESRRQELDLETLWQGILKRSLRDGEAVKGRDRRDDAAIADKVASRVQIAGSPSALSWQALKQASLQQRRFSTATRRLAAPPPAHNTARSSTDNEAAKSNLTDPSRHTGAQQQQLPQITLSKLQQNVADAQILARPIPDEAYLGGLVREVLVVPLIEDDTASQRLALVDQLLLTAHERGLNVLAPQFMAGLIEGIVLSPDQGPELEKALSKVEKLLASTAAPLEDGEIIRLMHAHASRRDWDRVWNMFQWNPRFQLPRSASIYVTMYTIFALTEDRTLCESALLRLYPEMMHEEPRIGLDDELYYPLKACISVAEPAAERLVQSPPELETFGTLDARRIQHNHFRIMLEELETTRAQMRTEAVRERAEEALLQDA